MIIGIPLLMLTLLTLTRPTGGDQGRKSSRPLALVHGTTVEGLTDGLAAGRDGAAAETAIAAEIETFVDDLRAPELVEEAEPVSDRPAPARDGAGYDPPRLEVFADMQDLLLLDPVHDVDNRGWPHPTG